MKRMTFAIALAMGLAASSALAQQTPHQHGPASTEKDHPEQDGGMIGESEAMQQHGKKMEEMRALMKQAHAATDPAERQRLMGMHRKMMHEHMTSMMQGDHAAMMQACQERMAMMHDMMGQMAAQHEMMPTK